jgi:TrmH family RNA methyltransferase
MNNTFSAGIKHPSVKKFIELKQNKRSNPENLISLEGYWELNTAFTLNKTITNYYYCPELLVTPELQKLHTTLISEAEKILTISQKTAERMSDRNKADGVFALTRLHIKELDYITLQGLHNIAVIDGIEIPGNAGTILRSADGAGIEAVIFINKKIRLTHPKIMHASMGTCFSLPLIVCSMIECQQFLNKNNFYTILANSQHKKNDVIKNSLNKAIIIGSEKYGYDPTWNDFPHHNAFIPMKGIADSLNAACAATVLFYKFFDK